MQHVDTSSEEELDLQNAMVIFSKDHRISLTKGPRNAFFRTPEPGGVGLATYVYCVLTEGGRLPILVREGPLVEKCTDDRWRIYFRYIQLAFPANAILVELPLN